MLEYCLDGGFDLGADQNGMFEMGQGPACNRQPEADVLLST